MHDADSMSTPNSLQSSNTCRVTDSASPLEGLRVRVLQPAAQHVDGFVDGPNADIPGVLILHIAKQHIGKPTVGIMSDSNMGQVASNKQHSGHIPRPRTMWQH